MEINFDLPVAGTRKETGSSGAGPGLRGLGPSRDEGDEVGVGEESRGGPVGSSNEALKVCLYGPEDVVVAPQVATLAQCS